MTRVVFRTFKKGGDTIALFPDLPWNHAGLIASYQHVGQHDGADYLYCIRATRPATADESAPLEAELESIGYEVRPVHHR